MDSSSTTTKTASGHSTARGFYILNVLRLCTIISLLTIIAAATATLVKSFVLTKFFFFDAFSHILLVATCIFLLLSECSLASTYFINNWPLFSKHAPLVWSGLAQMAVAVGMLGRLNEDYLGPRKIGTEVYTLLLAAGVVGVMVGAAVFVLSFVYRDKTQTARMARSIKRHRQRQYTPTPTLPAPAVAIQMPERAYVGDQNEVFRRPHRYREERQQAFYESDTSSLYSRAASIRDARERSEAYQKELP